MKILRFLWRCDLLLPLSFRLTLRRHHRVEFMASTRAGLSHVQESVGSVTAGLAYETCNFVPRGHTVCDCLNHKLFYAEMRFRAPRMRF
jgi:hypothetical protein